MTIDKSYWKYNRPILATQNEKMEHLKYEVDMFRSTCLSLCLNLNVPIFVKNLLVESLAIHSRILVDFFYNDLFLSEKKTRGGKDRQDQNDIIAKDFIPENINWAQKRPELTQILYDAREKSNKQLAHLSSWRTKLEKDDKKLWNHVEIKENIENVINVFENITNIRF